MARLNGGNVGSESVLVVPDTTGFRAALTAELKKIPPVKIDVFLKLNKAQVDSEIKRVGALKTAKLNVAINISKTAVNKAIQERNADPSLKSKLLVGVKVSAKQLKLELAKARKEAEAKNAPIVVRVQSLGIAETKAKLATLSRVLIRLTIQANENASQISRGFALTSASIKTAAHETNLFAKSMKAVEIASAKSAATIRRDFVAVAVDVSAAFKRTREEITRSVAVVSFGVRESALAGAKALNFMADTAVIAGAKTVGAFEKVKREKIKLQKPIYIRILTNAKAIAREFFALEKFIGRSMRFAGLAILGFTTIMTGAFLIGVTASIKSLAQLEVSARNAGTIFAELEPNVRKYGKASQFAANVTNVTNKAVEAARKISFKTTFAAKDLADGLFFLASANVRAKDAIGQLGNIANFAQAGLFDVSKASELLLQSVNATGVGITKLKLVSDLLTEANIRSQTTIEDLAIAITNKAGAAFRLAKQPLKETVGLLQELGNVGITGRRAGEGLAISIREVIKAASGAKDTSKFTPSEKFKELGINVFDAKGKVKSFSQVVDVLTDKIGNLSAKQQALTFKELGLTEKSNQVIRALIVRSQQLRTEGSSLKGKVDELARTAAGSTARLAKEQLTTLSARFAIFRNQIVGLAQIFAGPLSAAIVKFLGSLGGDGKLFDRLQEGAKKLGTELASNLIPFLESLKGESGKRFFEGLIDGFRQTLRGVKLFFTEFSKGFRGANGEQQDFLTSLGMFFREMGKLTATVGPAVGKILAFLARNLSDGAGLLSKLVKQVIYLYAALKILRLVLIPFITIFNLLWPAIARTSVALRAYSAGTLTAGAATKSLVPGLSRFLALLISPAGIVIGLGLATVAMGVWAQKHYEAITASKNLAISTNDFGIALQDTKEKLDTTTTSFDKYKDAISEAHKKSSELIGTLIDVGKGFSTEGLSSQKIIHRTNLALARQRAAVKAVQTAEKELADARIGLSNNLALTQANLAVSQQQETLDQKQRDDLQKAIDLTQGLTKAQIAGSHQRGASTQTQQEIAAASELIDSFGGQAKAKLKLLELNVRLLQGGEDQRSLQKQINDLTKKAADAVPKTAAQILKGIRDRRRERLAEQREIANGDSVSVKRATAIERANEVALNAAMRAQKEAFRELKNGIDVIATTAFANAEDRLQRFKGHINSKTEIKSFVSELQKIGQTDVGGKFLKSLNPKLLAEIDSAGTNKDKLNKIISQIGQTDVGKQFLNSLGFHFETARKRAARAGRTTALAYQNAAIHALSSAKDVPFLDKFLGLTQLAGGKGEVAGPGNKAFDAGFKFGKNIKEGAKTGLEADQKSINSSAVKHLVKDPLAAMKTAAGIASPSKLYHDEVGVPLAKGMMQGLIDGMRSQLTEKSALFNLLHIEIPAFIKKYKGPLAYDATILVPAGHAIMGGLTRGLRAGFQPVKSFLKTVGPSMEEFVPTGVFSKRVGKFLVDGISGTGDGFADPMKYFADLIPAGAGAWEGGAVDPGLSFLHKTLSLADTTQMAQQLGKLYDLNVTSLLRPPGTLTSSGSVSDHSKGTAADLSNGVLTPQEDALAAAMKPLFGTIFKQIIYRNKDQNKGYPIGGHLDHVHLAWLMANGFDINSGKIGKTPAAADVGGFGSLFQQASSAFDVPVAFIEAIAKAESGFNAKAHNPSGASGLMQLLPGTFASQHVGNNIFDPKQNIFAGTKYLKAQLNAFKTPNLAAAAYNAGPGNVTKYHGIPPFPETQKYVKRVLEFMKQFGGFRAMGGSVSAGKGYVVGERGPEAFVPNRPGFIMSNDRVDRLLRGLERQQSGGSGRGGDTIQVMSNAVDPAVVAGLINSHRKSEFTDVRL